MLAYLRVLAFYIGTAALLTWGLFALGLVDNLEMPGFEGSRTPVPTASLPAPEPPQKPAAVGREVKPPPAEQPKTVDAAPALQPSVQPVPIVQPSIQSPPPAATPERTIVAQPPIKENRVEPAAPRVIDAPKAVPAVKVAPLETAAAPVAVAPAAPPALPPVQPRVVDAAPAPTPQRPAVAPVQPSVSTPQVQAPQRAPQRPSTQTWWEASRRIAGYGFDGLIDQLETTKPSQDDIPCVMLREFRFKAGSAVTDAKVQAQIDLLAKVLGAFPDRRVEIGSRLGPGKPMATDAALRAGRVSAVRDGLLKLGVPGARLLVEPDGMFERVSEDVRRLGLARTQSIGICLRE